MSEEWDWELTDRSKQQLDALDEHTCDPRLTGKYT